jgi:hypothetical protein
MGEDEAYAMLLLAALTAIFTAACYLIMVTA